MRTKTIETVYSGHPLYKWLAKQAKANKTTLNAEKAKLSAAADISGMTIYRIIRCKNMPFRSVIWRISAATGIPQAEFYTFYAKNAQ